MRRLTLIATLLVATALPATSATAQTGAAASTDEYLAPLRIAHHKFVLDNGLAVLVHEDPSVPLVGEEYDSILRSQVARLPGRYETLDSLLAAAMDIVNTGRDPAYYADYASNLSALQPAALNAAAAGVVKPDALTWVIVGDLEVIEAGIRSLNLGDVRRIEAP